MKIGILGCGHIAEKMAYTINNVDGAELYAVGSRSIDRAKSFQKNFKAQKAYGSYEDLVSDSELELIYVATPHSRHFEDIMLCLTNGRSVLCEKAFTANSAQAKKVCAYAKEHNLFVGEAIWTRFLPMRSVLDDIIASGVVGEISSLTANLGYAIENKPRIERLELAGGALLDLGVYTINFALMAFGNDVAGVQSSCIKNEYGADMVDAITLTFADGKVAMLHATAKANTDRTGIIYGSKGRIEFANINNCEGIKVILDDGTVTTYDVPKQISGFEYELIDAIESVKAGKYESDIMPHSEIIRVMELMDSMRNEWGIRFPFE